MVVRGFLSFELSEAQREALDRYGTCTGVVESDRWRLGPRHPCLISVSGESVELIGLLIRGQRVATGILRYRLSRMSEVNPPLPLNDLINGAPARVRAPIERVIDVGGPFSPRAWQETKRIFGELRPQLAGELEELEGLSRSERVTPGSAGEEIVYFERDQVALAMEIAGVDRELLNLWSPEPEPASFLAGLERQRVGEDPAINFDARRLPGWQEIADNATGRVEFAVRDQRLTIFNVNRQPPERTLGADLIYYHHTFAAFVLVQYKRMRNEGGNRRRLAYRPDNDRSFARELERLRNLPVGDPDPAAPISYRLHPGAAWIKLCEPDVPARITQEMIPGIYLPLDYWDVLAASPDTRGPRGGRVFGYDTIKRTINNTIFAELVGRGFIGSQGVASDAIAELVRAGYDAGRSVTAAIQIRR